MVATKKISFGTLNLQNLQLPDEPMYRGNTWTAAQYEKKLTWLAGMVQRMDCDVIGFEELWSPRCLHDLFEKAGLADEYKLLTPGGRSKVGVVGRKISTAAAVRKPHGASAAKWVRDFPKEFSLIKRKSGDDPDYKMRVGIDAFSRPVLRFRVSPDGREPIDVFVAHFKSKLPMQLDSAEKKKPSVRAHSKAIGEVLSTVRRASEAGALRVILNKLMKKNDRAVVVMGDLNDAPNSVIASILTADPSYRLNAKSTTGNSSDGGLYSAGLLQDLRSFRDVSYTYIFKGKRESLDHVLVSEQFSDWSKKRRWSFVEQNTINDHLDERRTKAQKDTYSDHAAVVARFVYHPAKKRS